MNDYSSPETVDKKPKSPRTWVLIVIVVGLLSLAVVLMVLKLDLFRLHNEPDPVTAMIPTRGTVVSSGITEGEIVNGTSEVPADGGYLKTPTPSQTPNPTATSTNRPPPTHTAVPTPQPQIDENTVDPGQCPYHTHLTHGMYAFALGEVNIYDIPRYDNRVNPHPVIRYTLKPGDRVLISTDRDPGAQNPQCVRNSYFWYIQTAFEDPDTDPGIEGWVFEYYYPHRRDAKNYWDPGYYLGPYPP